MTGVSSMIQIITCDDSKELLAIVKQEIDKIIPDQKEIETYYFSSYNSEFWQLVNYNNVNEEIQPSITRIYILDIVVQNDSGIDVAREIRSRDTQAYILFLSAHEQEYKDIIFASTIRYYAFVSKDNVSLLEGHLKNIMKEIRKSRKHTLAYWEQGQLYVVVLEDLLYVTTDKANKKTLFVSANDCYPYREPLKKVKKILPPQFVKTHRAYIVNLDHVVPPFSFQKKTITFDNGETIKGISSMLRRDEVEKLLKKK